MQPLTPIEKRWQDGAQRWTAPDRDVFRPALFAVDVVPERAAKAFVTTHHYSHTFPAARLTVGLFGPGAELVGTAVFSQPMTDQVLSKHAGATRADACELGRFVCLDSVAYNGESWFLARAFRLLRSEKGIRAVVSFADPLEYRQGALVVKSSHWGTIYQASNATYVGRSWARTHLVAPDGRPVSPRALSKIRAQDRGSAYAERQLVQRGAPARAFGESPNDWLDRVMASPGFTHQRHPGNLTYVFGLDALGRSRIAAQHGAGLPYPRARAA